jgi:predicted membrane protein
MYHIMGIGILMLWSLGFLVPFTLIGFIEILLIISFLILLMNKIRKLRSVITKQD